MLRRWQLETKAMAFMREFMGPHHIQLLCVQYFYLVIIMYIFTVISGTTSSLIFLNIIFVNFIYFSAVHLRVCQQASNLLLPQHG